MLIVCRLALFQWLVDVSKHGGCCTYIRASYASYSFMVVVVNVAYLTLTDPLRVQPWSQDRRDQTKSNREHVRRKMQGKQTDENGQEKGARKRRGRQEGT